jgi:hypothetical protein
MPDNASDKVRITNNGRRPLVIRCPSQTLRLAAGERTSVLRGWLKTSELRGLCETGLVTVAELPGEAAAQAGRRDAVPDAGAQPRRGARRPSQRGRTEDSPSDAYDEPRGGAPAEGATEAEKKPE